MAINSKALEDAGFRRVTLWLRRIEPMTCRDGLVTAFEWMISECSRLHEEDPTVWWEIGEKRGDDAALIAIYRGEAELNDDGERED